MAYRKSSAIGDLHGRVENMVFRTRNKKNIAYARPLNQKVSKSKKAVTARNNFGAANTFSSAINSAPALQTVWSVAKVRGSNAYQRMVSMNTRLARNGSLTASNVITPPGQFFKLNSAVLENENIRLSFLCPECAHLTFPAHLFVYLLFVNSDGGIVPMEILLPEPEPEGIYEIDVVPDVETKRLLVKDPSPIVYVAIAGGTSYKKKVYWTSTAAAAL